ncbi:MAG: LytTR family DNA-binding domain-containing protein [Hyphomonas sp.]|uniref:LytTR family DNA-binding domain-containing protein n=1 Tax=Hyphomonas sp. TaxID=87 RepID=UPI003528B7CF
MPAPRLFTSHQSCSCCLWPSDRNGLAAAECSSISSHARVHRSHIVNLDRVRAISPTGEGDAVIELDTGETVPGSRRYRDRFAPAA